jgi:hypothetical protein
MRAEKQNENTHRITFGYQPASPKLRLLRRAASEEELIMERDVSHTSELIELGRATVETKGPFGDVDDETVRIPRLGLADD